MTAGLYKVTGEGKSFIDGGGYGFKKFIDDEEDVLKKRKLELQVKNAERIRLLFKRDT